ncbi:monocarboxylate transporter 14-like [Ornithodoros turicata]
MVNNRASLMTDPVHGLDSRWSWTVAAFCSWLLFAGTLSTRVVGIVYYGVVETFEVTRQEAAWPVTLSCSLLNLAGPAMGFLCRKLSCRTVLMTCSLITGFGIMVCFFAPNVLFLNMFFGVVHGATMSGVFVGTNVVVAQHFQKRRTTACSVVFTVCGLNTLLIPPVMEYFRAQYGIRGALLLLGALTANAFPATIALRSPPWSIAPKEVAQSRRAVKGQVPTATASPKANPLRENLASVEAGKLPIAAQVDLVKKYHIKREAWTGSMESFGIPTEPIQGALASTQQHHNIPSLRETLRNFATLKFCVDALSFAVVLFGFSTFMLLSVDLAKDRGIVPADAAYLLNAFCAGDIVFRAISGCVVDSGWLSLEAVMLTGYLMQAAVYETLIWCTTLPTLLMCAVVLGASNGFRIGMQAPIMIHDFGIEVLPIMMGGLAFIIGSVALGRPALVGYYRDRKGKYDGLLHIIAVANIVFVGVWTIRLFIQKRAYRRTSLRAKDNAPMELVVCSVKS